MIIDWPDWNQAQHRHQLSMSVDLERTHTLSSTLSMDPLVLEQNIENI